MRAPGVVRSTAGASASASTALGRRVGHHRHHQLLLGQDAGQPLGPTGRRGAQHHRVAGPHQTGHLGGQLGPVPQDGLPAPRSTSGMSGPSAVGTSETTPADVSVSSRSKGTCSRGASSPCSRPHVEARASARAASSSSSSPARSRTRRGSTRTTRASDPAGRRRAPRGRPARAATTPCRRTGRRRPAGPTGGDPTAGVPTRRAARSRMASSATSSRQPNSSMAPRSSMERWSATSNRVSRSTSSPHRSMRTGSSAVEGKTSTIPPRTASSPRCSTMDSRR